MTIFFLFLLTSDSKVRPPAAPRPKTQDPALWLAPRPKTQSPQEAQDPRPKTRARGQKLIYDAFGVTRLLKFRLLGHQRTEARAVVTQPSTF